MLLGKWFNITPYAKAFSDKVQCILLHYLPQANNIRKNHLIFVFIKTFSKLNFNRITLQFKDLNIICSFHMINDENERMNVVFGLF